MKKLISLLLAVCMCLSVGVMLTACGGEKHTHTYKTEWSKDVTHHWHACEGEDCTDVADKAEHTWNEGEITTEATTEADGVKTYTCTVCAQTKTESVQLKTTVTEAEWNAAFERNNFTLNGYLTERDEQESLLMQITDSMIHIKNEGISRYYVKDSDGWHISDGIAVGPVMNGISASVRFAMMSFHLPEYASFTYDEEVGAYVYVKADSASGFYKFSVYFENGVVVKIDGEERAEVGVTHSFNFENYGTTVVDMPNATVTEEEWETAFAFDYNYEIRADFSVNNTVMQTLLMQRVGNILKGTEETSSGFVGVFYDSVENGRFYSYTYNDGHPLAEGYEYIKYDKTQLYDSSNAFLNSWMSEYTFEQLLGAYNDFEYNPETKRYEAQNHNGFDNVWFSFANGKIIQAGCDMTSEYGVANALYNFSYNSISNIVLPEAKELPTN